jgi:hypothetical protein
MPHRTCAWSTRKAKQRLTFLSRRTNDTREPLAALQWSRTATYTVAQVFAAIQDRNRRLSATGLPLVNATVLPGILMIGSAPFFYKIHVTRTLAGAVPVERGQYPAHTTFVQRFKLTPPLAPPVQNQRNIYEDGMLPLENRYTILSCYEAFRRFV